MNQTPELRTPGDSMKFRFMAMNPVSFGACIYAYRENLDGTHSVLHRPILTTVQPGERMPDEPLMGGLERHHLQSLMDQMYDMGVRPTNELKAATGHIENHLADMRKIVFDRLDIPNE